MNSNTTKRETEESDKDVWEIALNYRPKFSTQEKEDYACAHHHLPTETPIPQVFTSF